jgi:hypothetical protein
MRLQHAIYYFYFSLEYLPLVSPLMLQGIIVAGRAFQSRCRPVLPFRRRLRSHCDGVRVVAETYQQAAHDSHPQKLAAEACFRSVVPDPWNILSLETMIMLQRPPCNGSWGLQSRGIRPQEARPAEKIRVPSCLG